jgi:S1-C subfamily serine protease
MKLKTVLVALFCLTVCTVCVLADTLRLKDGTVLEGKVIEQPDRYWIKLADGTSKTVLKKDVLNLERGDAKPNKAGVTVPGGTAPAGKPASGTPISPGTPGGGSPAGASASFAAVKAKADRVDAPIQAVQMWEAFTATKPSQQDLEAAKSELARWEQLKKDNAEKIKGVWVGGVERKKIVKQAKNLVSDGVKKIEEGQSTVGFKKIEEALNLYPQSFEANFHLGLYYLKKSTINVRAQFDLASLDKAVKTLETASKIAPKSSSVWSNLAIGYSFKKKHREAIETAYKACIMHESKATVTNLIGALGNSPRGVAEQTWCKPIFDEAVLMAGRHGVELGTGFYYLAPTEGDEIPGADSPAGSVWSGSGFFVTTDGYLITNHHVATGEPKTPIKPEITFRVRMDDGTEKTAELIAVDDAADIAVMKIVPDAPVTPLKLADYYPEQGAEALVLGYPATGESEHTMEISNGTIKSVHEGDEHEVWFNLNTTHGNSGGPIVDASNNVIAILTAGRESFNMVITLGVSSQQIKTFLGKIGDKAPKVEWVKKPAPMPGFSAETLTKSARTSTVLVIAVRSAE